MVISGPDATGRINVNFMKEHRNNCSYDTGNYHGCNERTANAGRYQKCMSPIIPLKEMNIYAKYSKCHHTKHKTICKTILASFKIRPSFCFAFKFSSISTRIVTASDCVPTLPAISSTIDWKQMTTGKTATTASNMPTTEETNIPKN